MFAAGTGCVTAQPARADDAPAAAREEARAAQQAAEAALKEARRAETQAGQAAAEVRAKIRASGFGGAPTVDVYARKVKKEKAAYLGVTTSPVAGALREHMKLQRGFGLVVDTVEETSAAGQAGIQQFDILQKLNDQLLINTQQLSVLIRSMKPNDKVSITLLRGGQSSTVDVTLQEKELPVLGEASGGFGGEFWTTEAPMGAARAAFPAVNSIELSPAGELQLFRSFADEASSSQSVYSDSEMSLTISGTGDERTLEAKDADGTVLFEGPIATDDQRKTLPDKVAEKLTKFESRLEKIGTSSGKNIRVRVIEP